MSLSPRLIECDSFPFEFLSKLAERESWRKEIHRPIYHVHKWWAKRLGSVFRGILLGCRLDESADLTKSFYETHSDGDEVIFDPFMGSGTTIGEAHKLGMIALGRDINPVAYRAVKTGLGNLCEKRLREGFETLKSTVGNRIRSLYQTIDSRGRTCEVLYFFWVMEAKCPVCSAQTDLFSSYVFAKNARPNLKPVVHCICSNCGDVFTSFYGNQDATCPSCSYRFDPTAGPARGTEGSCIHCQSSYKIRDAVSTESRPPQYRLYAKLVLRNDGHKSYLRTTEDDNKQYELRARELEQAIINGEFAVPSLPLTHGHNTRQAMGYGFHAWRDFFNQRQLLGLSWLRVAIDGLGEYETRQAFQTLFSGVLEFNNLFASYKGEGTGAVRHMFSHHILKPERMPIEANIWGTPKSSGSFSGLFPNRLLRAAKYQKCPTEVSGHSGPSRLCSKPISGEIQSTWPINSELLPGAIYLSCGDSSTTKLTSECVDFVVTDPPFFDNVHYSELADFFHSWQPDDQNEAPTGIESTRNQHEVQDKDAGRFASKLSRVFGECERLLKRDGLLVFTYHHSREDGWTSLASAVLQAGFVVVNCHPIKAEMSVATPKSQAKQPIQFDIVLICIKRKSITCQIAPEADAALAVAKVKAERLLQAGFTLSQNDWKIIQYGQLMTVLRDAKDLNGFDAILCRADVSMDSLRQPLPIGSRQAMLF